MAVKPPYLTSSTLIDSVRRRCSLPKSDSMFSDEDILEFANDEMLESILPMIKGTHEEYFVWNIIVQIEANKSRYEIPERALGSALRDVSFIDEQGDEYEMTRILRDDRYTTQFPSTYNQPYRFYVENTEIVLVPNVENTNIVGGLQLSFLLRPNNLVESTRVSKVQSITDGTIGITSTTIGSTTTIVTSSNHFLTNDESVTISGVTGTGSSLVNGTHTVTVVNDLTFTIAVDTTGQGPFNGGSVANNTKNIVVDTVPECFSTSNAVDFLRTKSPHNTLGFDIFAKSILFTSNVLIFKTIDVSDKLSAGDTIALTYETDIPGIPTELHRLLVSKTCERVMESLGDQAGMAAATRKSAQSQNAAQNYLENRVTSAPLKVRNTSGFLNRKYRRTRRF